MTVHHFFAHQEQLAMRAPFDRLIDLYFGPGTPTPGAPYSLLLPARVVPDLVFRDLDAPLNASLAYFTCDRDAPIGALFTPGAPGVYTADFTQGNTVSLVPGTAPTHITQRVELRTRPGSPDYFRAYIAPLNSLWTPCQLSYPDPLHIQPPGGAPVVTLTKIGPTTWVGGSWTITAETTAVVPVCRSVWSATDGTRTYLSAPYDGSVLLRYDNPLPPFDFILVYP